MGRFVSFRNTAMEREVAINVDQVAYVEKVPMYSECIITFSGGAKVGVDGHFQEVMTKLLGKSSSGIW